MAKESLRKKILLAALPDVAFDGWTDVLLARAAKKAHIPDKALRSAFPDGIDGLVRFFSIWADDEMLKKMGKAKKDRLRVRDRVALGVRARLEVLGPWKEAVSASLARLALPPRCLTLPQMLWDTADRIWDAAGDDADDYNRYTKRLLLAGVLAATTLYWLNDDSKGNAATWEFLERRIDNAVSAGRRMSSFVPGRFRKEGRA